MCGLAMLATVAWLTAPGRADDLRNVRRGEPVPAYQIPTIDGAVVTSEALAGKVIVMVCLSAEQRRSELAAMDSSSVIAGFDADDVQMIHVTADAIHKSYFEKFRHDRRITAPLAFDADRALFANLGLIVYPTTLVVDREGNLAHVISLHGDDYKHALDAYVRHSLEEISDEELDEELNQRSARDGTPKSSASAHRALARSHREHGRLQAAHDELVKAREQDPTNREVLLDIADLELALGELDEAERIIALVLDSQPDHRRARQLKGIALFRRGMLDEAQAELEESLVLNPRPEVAHYYLGMICEQRGDLPGATAHYREAIEHVLGAQIAVTPPEEEEE
jgi:peroxiredoxin